MLCPVSTFSEIATNAQLKAREFWTDMRHPELDTTIRYPGAFIKMSETPVAIKRRAPLISEHNLDIYEGELGLSRSELAALEQARII